ncbi:MAG: ATP-binding protein [Patescibacteria group bacterium]
MTIENIFIITAGIANLVLGSLVYFNDKKSLINRVFGIFAFTLTLWSVNSFLFYDQNYPIATSLILAHFLYGTVIIIIPTLLYFVCIFPSNVNLKKRYILLIFGSVVPIFFITIFSDLMIESVILTDYGKKVVFGPLFIVYAFYIVVYIVLSIFILFKKYKNEYGKIKIHIRYILTGVIISGILGIIANIILPIFGIFNIDRFGSASTIALVVFTAYAISKYNLLDIKIIATQFFILLLSFVLFINSIYSKTFNDFIVKFILFIAVSSVGYLLVKSVSREINIRKKLEDLTMELQKANEDLRQLDAAKSEFLSIASHQLRTPLSIIKGYISVILEGDTGEINDKQKDYLGRVYRSNEKLIMLVSDFLNLSRIESGRIIYDFSPISVFSFTENIVEELRPKAVAKNLILKFNKSADNDSFIIYGDKNTLAQVLFNIIDNGIRYTERGSVEIDLINDNENVVWKIRDTGAGINDEENKNLFQKMKRGERISHIYTEGTGLGLYIAKKIINAHNGSIWAESEGVDKGSIFYVKIPVNNNRLNG